MFNTKAANQGYNTLSPYDDVSDVEDDYALAPQPLRMNPPTPPPAQIVAAKKTTPPPSTLQRTQTTTSMSTDATFNRSHSQKRSGTPKSRYYGDLAAATSNIRKSANNSPNVSPTKGSFRNQPNHFPSATKQYISNTPPSSSHSPVKNSPFTLDKKSYTSVRRTGETGNTPVKHQSPRVVSRSGVDYINPYEFDDSDLGTPGRRRDVSGKIAEEGRGGMGANGWRGMTHRKISGMA